MSARLSSAVIAAISLRIAVAQVTPYSLPIGDFDTTARAEAIAAIRENFNYGPNIVDNGGGPFFPVGPYADELIANWSNAFFPEHTAWTQGVQAEAQTAAVAITLEGGLTNYNDYATKLYDSLWNTTIPHGVAPGMLTNYTSDLLFSMERLSAQPYSIRRVKKSDPLNFKVDDKTSRKLTTQTQTQLQKAGRLFYVDYRNQADFILTTGRYAGACDAFFYIHPKSGDFLPLAIRPNNGSPLIYTPADPANDWQLAKMLFELNDFWYHFVATHEVVDLVYEAAVRTLSIDHPVHALMTRLAYQAFVFPIVALKSLLNVGGPVDSYFAWSGSTAEAFATKLYDEGAAPWISNYFSTHLENRGLINSPIGPELKSFPFYEDASVIYSAIKSFVQQFVESYYTDESLLSSDGELQSFLAESVPAKIVDFPTSLSSRSELVDLLTHFGYLVSILHGVMNGGDPVITTATLPLHPAAFYQPLPITKGLSDSEMFSFMPNLTQSLGQIVLFGAFNRPFFEGGNRTLSQMFSDPTLLERSNDATRKAATNFEDEMLAFSKVVRARAFDENGLSQGMPFIWKLLDPLTVPFYLTI
ncbi:putative arachidonate 5-lipoxygenase [Atractiella rhizophila]|nr:putative arachidonate 5-lipoxygenase [Atractiella rhizophila]